MVVLKPVPLVAVALVLTVLAGCIGDDDRPLPPVGPGARAIVPAESITPISGDPLPEDGPMHDHADPAQHDVAKNMALLAKPEIPDSDAVHYWNQNIPLGLNIRFGELDVKGDWLAQCSRDAEGAYLWDISNRSAPVLTSRLIDTGPCPDIKLTDDANWVVIGGNKLYDITNKADPVYYEMESPGCHMCSIATIDGQEYIVLSAQGQGVNLVARNVNTAAGFTIVKFTRGETPELEVVGTWMKDIATESVPTLAEQDIANTVHDQYVYHDKLLNKTVVVPAMWDYGIYMVDISDPTNPTDLGHWGAYRGESGNIHTTAVDFRMVNGEERRIIAAATETGWIIGGVAATEPGYLYIFDATDPADIQLLGKWANPGMRPTGVDPMFFPVGEYSAHNIQFTQGRVYMAHYHAGVWVIDVDAFLATDPAPKGDIRTPMVDDIPSLGVYLTTDESGNMPGQVWDVVVKDGHIYASDYALGLYVLRFLGDPLNDPAYTGTA